MIKHTTDLAEKAWSIAEHEAEAILQKTGDFSIWNTVLISTYQQTLKELQPLEQEESKS